MTFCLGTSDIIKPDPIVGVKPLTLFSWFSRGISAISSEWHIVEWVFGTKSTNLAEENGAWNTPYIIHVLYIKVLVMPIIIQCSWFPWRSMVNWALIKAACVLVVLPCFTLIRWPFFLIKNWELPCDKVFCGKVRHLNFQPAPTGDSNETYQTEVWFIHLFRHHCGSMVSRAHGLSICGSGNCNALDRDFDGEKNRSHQIAAKILCGAYALLDV